MRADDDPPCPKISLRLACAAAGRAGPPYGASPEGDPLVLALARSRGLSAHALFAAADTLRALFFNVTFGAALTSAESVGLAFAGRTQYAGRRVNAEFLFSIGR